MSAKNPGRSMLVLVAAALSVTALAASPAWAAPEGRIQDIQSSPGTVTYVLAAEGLAEGESIDPGSVTTTIAGQEAPSTAVPLTEEVATPVNRTTVLVLDSSGSMAEFGKLDTAKQSAKAYLDSLPPDVKAGLVTFADTARVQVEPTDDRAAVVSAIDSLEAEGSTALNDAVILATQTLGTEGVRNALLLSDGEDEGSEASARKARRTLAASGVVLDAVSLGQGDQQQQLAAFAEAGSGTVVTATDSAQLTAAFEAAARTVTTQLAVRAQVPAGLAAGTEELVASAVAAGSPITASAAAIIQPAAPTATEEAGAPVVVEPTPTGVFGEAWFLFAVIAFIFVALATVASVAVGALDSKNRKEGRVARRLEEVSMLGEPSAAVAATKSETALGDSSVVRRTVSFADRVAATRDTTTIARQLEDANVSLRPGEWVVVHGLIIVLAGLLTAVLTDLNLLWTILALVLAGVLPWFYLGYRAEQRRKKFYTALPDAMQMLAGSLSAGYSLPQALDNVAREAGGPLGEEINRALLESRLGLPIEETLEAVAQRMQSQDFHWVVMAIRINRKVGGNLAEVLTNVGKTLRERERLRRQVKTLTAEGKLTAVVLALLPVGLIFYTILVRPEYVALLVTTVPGWFMVIAGVILYIAGIIWIRNLVNMEV